MNLIDLSLPALRLCAVVFYVLCLTSLFCAALAFRLPSAKGVFACGLFTGLLTFPVATFLSLYFGRLLSGRTAEDHIRLFLSLPVWAIGLLAVLSLAAVVLMNVRLRRLYKGELTAQSLCEGLDQLPDGISYSLPDGFPKLVNSRMQAISNAAFGIGVTDTLQLDKKLKTRDLQPGCSVDEDENNIFLRLPDGTVWQMKQRQVESRDSALTEMLAFDVTERYNNLAELRQRNEKLENVNRELRSYLDNMNRIVREREVLAAKTWLHNELGQCLLAIESYLKETGGDRDLLVQQLTQAILLMQIDAPDQRSDPLSDLFQAAKALDMEIRIEGTLPQNWKSLIEIAIHECLTNTVKHAHGRLVQVTITEDGDDYVIALTNDGDPPKVPVRETGGLANLRALTEWQGGTMEIESAPVFRLALRLKKDGTPISAPDEL